MQDTNKYKVYKALIAVGRWLLFAIVSFLILFPVLWIFVSSITPPGELFKMPIDYIPDHPTLESYKFLIENVGLLEKIGNTVLIVGVTIVVSTVICAMAAYGFSRFRTKGISIAFAFIIATMLIPEVVTARPLYEFMRAVGLYDTYPGLIILYISAVIPFTVLILKNFASEIPISLEEAAMIDGCTPVQTYFKVIVPMLRPTMITVAILNAMWIWNDYLLPYLVLDIKKYKTIPIVIQYLKGGYGAVDLGTMMAMLVLAILPIIVFYLTCQKYIIKGVAAGAVKG